MRLYNWLTDQGITHSEMARRMGGVSAEAVRLWAAGRRMPDTKHILRIEQVTNGDVSVLDLHEARVETLTKARRRRG